MPMYSRAFRPGGTFFLTIVTEQRAPILGSEDALVMLRAAFERCRVHHPFEVDAMVVLRDHLHMLMKLPDGETDFSVRVTNLKSHFTRAWLAAGGEEQARSVSRVRQRSRGVWLKRFWEHTIRDDEDLRRHRDYIHYNPVKHQYARCPREWAPSTFHRFVKEERYEADWHCQCDRPQRPFPASDDIAGSAGE